MNGTYRPVESDGSGSDRAVLRAAVSELNDAGYELRDNAMVDKKTGQPLAFEIMVTTKEEERLALAYTRTLDRIGIEDLDPPRRFGPVPAAPENLRLRHDPLHLERLAFARATSR